MELHLFWWEKPWFHVDVGCEASPYIWQRGQGCPVLGRLMLRWYPLVNIQKTMERSTIFNGNIHYKLPFSIAMWNYQMITTKSSARRIEVLELLWISRSHTTYGTCGISLNLPSFAMLTSTARQPTQAAEWLGPHWWQQRELAHPIKNLRHLSFHPLPTSGAVVSSNSPSPANLLCD